MPSTKHMDVKVRDGLATIRAIIDDHAEARLAKSLLLRQRLGNHQQMPEQWFVIDRTGADASDLLFRHDQKMDRGLGINVVERQALPVLVNDPGRDFACDDLGKDGAHMEVALWLAVERRLQQPRGLNEALMQYLRTRGGQE